MDTIKLTDNWDWTVDADGNWAGLTQADGALAQDAASEGRLFLGEAWYDIARGVPYWQAVLGHWPPLSSSAIQSTRHSPTRAPWPT